MDLGQFSWRAKANTSVLISSENSRFGHQLMCPLDIESITRREKHFMTT